MRSILLLIIVILLSACGSTVSVEMNGKSIEIAGVDGDPQLGGEEGKQALLCVYEALYKRMLHDNRHELEKELMSTARHVFVDDDWGKWEQELGSYIQKHYDGKLVAIESINPIPLDQIDSTMERGKRSYNRHIKKLEREEAIANQSPAERNTGAAAATLKAAIFPGQIHFQAGKYNDADANGVGRFGFIDEMAGNRATIAAMKGELALITGPLSMNKVPATSKGYYFKVYLPNGEDAAFSSADQIKMGHEDALMERKYICYAWPINKESGDKIFAMTEDGQLLSMTSEYDHRYDNKNLPPFDLIWGDKKKWGRDLVGWAYHTK